MTQQHTQEQWQDIINQWQASGLTAAAFCQQHNVVYHNFLYWRKKLTRSASNKLVPVVSEPSLSTVDTIELVLPGGLRIQGIHNSNLSVAIEWVRQL